ncbi:MAG TPA: right-handed parallel beta-helix repeat-containing protein [Casimicrobiaceae bacterium]|nr:right-handed parallel beta-helix repeat-containing protein [Casimicrobiaceae bacterium]
MGKQKPIAQIVRPGQSIQSAIDNAPPGGWIYILPGVYHETANATNGLNISASVNLVGLSTPSAPVVLENAGNQANGVVVVPQDRTECMSCHASLAPPFSLLPGVSATPVPRPPMMNEVSIRGITIRSFNNNGLFLENVDGFSIVDVQSVDNKNYGIFPTLSRNGVVSNSHASGSGDTGIWVETSSNVLVTGNLVENNVVGFEVSNSDNIFLEGNESRNNSVGMGIFLLSGLFASHPGASAVTATKNSIHDNNRANDAPPNTILGFLPPGTGVLVLGVDSSLLSNNDVENNNLAGIAIVDVCLAFAGSSFDCSTDPKATDAYLADQDATNDRVVRNKLVHNGTAPGPTPFAFAAGDLTLLSTGAGNCFGKNSYATSFSIEGFLPACP